MRSELPRVVLMLLLLLQRPIIRLHSCARRIRRRRLVCSIEAYFCRITCYMRKICRGCTRRSISFTAWCRTCRRLPAAASTGARWTGTRRRSCSRANRRARFCCAIRHRKSFCFPFHSESTTGRCMLASSSSIISLVSIHVIRECTRPRR